MRVKDSAKSAAAEGSGCRETDGVGADQNDGRDLLRAHAMTLRIDVAITRMARTTPYPSERDPMVKSRSKISRQPVKKSKKTAARTARGGSREKSRSAEAAARAAPSKTAAKGKKRKWVYAFGGGKAQGRAGMRKLLGGKGAGLAEMSHLGLPVPPGFTITTEVCTYFHENGKTYPKISSRKSKLRLRRSAASPGRNSAMAKIRCSSRYVRERARRCRA
jgi:hypothetical protein